MEMIKRFEPIALLIVVLGALNWGMVGLFETNVISDVFGTGTLTDASTRSSGSAAFYVPKVLEGMHLQRPHAAPPRHLSKARRSTLDRAQVGPVAFWPALALLQHREDVAGRILEPSDQRPLSPEMPFSPCPIPS